MKQSNPYQNFVRAVAACTLMLASGTALAAAGKVVFSAGDVQVDRAGKTAPLAKGADIEQGDTIVTGADGRVQFRMADGDFMALRPNTRLRVDKFRKPTSAKEPETGLSFFSLLKGGFRAVTHSLDRRGQNSYRVNTPVATLGIRGTKYSALLCADDCEGTIPDGLYLGVSDGGVNLGNSGGKMGYGAGEFGYVKDENTPPTKLPNPPQALNGGGGGNTQGGGNTGGYSGGSPPQGCTNPMSGDVNCPPVQTIHGGDHDFTGGQSPAGPSRGPPTDDCSECGPR